MTIRKFQILYAVQLIYLIDNAGLKTKSHFKA